MNDPKAFARRCREEHLAAAQRRADQHAARIDAKMFDQLGELLPTIDSSIWRDFAALANHRSLAEEISRLETAESEEETLVGRLLWLARANDAAGLDAALRQIGEPALDELKYRQLIASVERIRYGQSRVAPKSASPSAPVGTAIPSMKPPIRPRLNVNARMLDKIQRDPESRGWTVTQWQTHLQCARDSIHRTPTWKELSAGRKVLAADRALSKRRQTKGRTTER
jgi:hypothetical protein